MTEPAKSVDWSKYVGSLPLPDSTGWECFQDTSYYDMWCVRPKASRSFGEGFHLVSGDEAEHLCALLNAQGVEARQGGDEGTVHDSPVSEGHAPETSLGGNS